MKNKKETILYSNDSYSLSERDGVIGIKPMFMDIIIMPFTCDENKLPLLVGVVEEKNPFREGGNNISLISGNCDDGAPDLFTTARKTLLDLAGMDVSDSSRWYYLGTSTASKFVDSEYPCFAVDVTDITKTELEKENNFKFIPANDVVKVKDIFIPGLFLKLFKYVMGMNISNPDQKGPIDKNVHNLTL